MRLRLLVSSVVVSCAVALGTAAFAQQKKGDHSGHKHSEPKAQAGGTIQEVGEYNVEIAVKDGKLLLLLSDHDSKEASADGMKASVLLTAGSQRIGPVEVKPAGGNKMEGPVAAVPKGATAILTLTDKDGTAAQGRFKLQ